MTRRRDAKTARFIGNFVRKGREKKFPGRGGKSAAAIAFGVTSQAWGSWELGKSIPDDVNQRRLAEFFGVSLADLRGDRSPPTASGAEPEPPEIPRATPETVTRLMVENARLMAENEGLRETLRRADAHIATLTTALEKGAERATMKRGEANAG